MTRINVVEPSYLSDRHLLAEYRELPRVFTLVKRTDRIQFKQPDKFFPKEYTLGKGHVRFFYPRCLYLIERYNDIIDEMIVTRGFKPDKEIYLSVFKGCEDLPRESLGFYTPTKKAIETNKQRLKERDTSYEKQYTTNNTSD